MTMTYEAPIKVKPTYGYYRQPNGWVTASPATDTDELQYRRSGWTPLRAYGNFEITTPYSNSHPLEVLFMRGGAHELPVDQIIQMGLHLNPPMVPGCKMPLSQKHKWHLGACLESAQPVVFPQLAGVTGLEPFPCKICSDRIFPTAAARDQHTMVMHAAEKSDERTGQSLAEALVKGLNGQSQVAAPPPPPPPVQVESSVNPALMSAILEKMEALQQELEALKAEKAEAVADAPGDGQVYVSKCVDCGQGFRSFTNQRYANQALGVHRKTKHPKA